MKNFTLTGMALLCLSLIFFRSNAQTTGDAIVGKAALDKIAESAKHKKSGKLAEQYTSFDTLNDGRLVPIMRVPTDRISGNAQLNIVQVQASLDDARAKWRAGQLIKDIEDLQYKIKIVGYKDLDWVTDYYKAEVDFYNESQAQLRANDSENLRQIKLERRRQEIKLKEHQEDSIQSARRRVREQLYAEEQRKRDSIAYLERTRGWHFVNIDKLSLREKPTSKSKKLGIIGAGSYVKVLSKTPSNGYVKIQASDYQGFVYADYLVDNIDLLTVEGVDVASLKKSYQTTIETSGRPQDDGIRLIRGPKGGCYYIGPSGQKIYVDRSLCD